MRSPALSFLALASLLAFAGVLAQPSTGPSLALDVSLEDPGSLPAGAEETIAITVQRHADGGPAPGPGEVDLHLDAAQAPACQPTHQGVELDPLTGRGHANVTCRPQRPGTWPLEIRAEAEAHRPANGTTVLEVRPDRLTGSLSLGEPEAYRFPLSLSLEPVHLDEAPVEVQIEAEHASSPLGFAHGPIEHRAEGSSLHEQIVARHGPGSYGVRIHAEGPLTRTWNATTSLDVPDPPETGHLELNATVAPGDPQLALAGDGVNDDGKTKRPGGELITRLTSEHVDQVNVTVLRAEADERIELEARSLAVGEDGRLEHVFAHEPLPAEQLWVHAEAGESSVVRTAQVRDLRAEAHLDGPEAVLADGRPWQAQLGLQDPNFGSTPIDPGPVFGLPDVSWTVYRGSFVAEGFAVEVGPFAGGSEGEAETSRIPWPQGADTVDADPGEATFPLRVWPPDDAKAGTYRLSVYAPDGTRLGGGSWQLEPAPQPTIEAGRAQPGEALAVAVDVQDPVEGTSVDIVVHAGGRRVEEAHLADLPGETSLELPAPLPAGTPVRVEAWSDWPGRPGLDQPDAVLERTVPDVAPTVEAHAVLDGVPSPMPVPVHPAGGHDLEVAYTALDPNEGPIELAEANLEGPDGSPDWPLAVEDELVRLSIPEGVPVGRYALELVADDGEQTRSTRVPLDVAPTLRLGVEGPKQVRLEQSGSRRVNLTLANLGSQPVAEVSLFVETELAIGARLGDGTSWVQPGEPLELELAPGAEVTVPVVLRAEGDPGQGSVSLTLAGVAP